MSPIDSDGTMRSLRRRFLSLLWIPALSLPFSVRPCEWDLEVSWLQHGRGNMNHSLLPQFQTVSKQGSGLGRWHWCRSRQLRCWSLLRRLQLGEKLARYVPETFENRITDKFEYFGNNSQGISHSNRLRKSLSFPHSPGRTSWNRGFLS